MAEKPFTRYKGLIRETYENPALMSLLTEAKPGEPIKRKDIAQAGASIEDFQAQDSDYVETVSGGVAFTKKGKALFESQLIADGQDKSSEKKPKNTANHNHMYLGMNGAPMRSFGAIEQDRLDA